MSTNSKCRILLCLALPLTLAVGCASDPNRPTATAFEQQAADTSNNNELFNIDIPTPTATVSKQQAADMVINNEIFKMVLADTDINYNLWDSINKGVVTLDVMSSNGAERQRVVNEVWELAGVKQVKDRRGVNLASTSPEKTIAVR